MKRTLSFILAMVMILSLCACGSKDSEGPPEPTEWVISTEYITQRVEEFADSEELCFLLDNHRSLVDYHGQDKTYGPYLTGAAEVYALYGNGEGYHFILMGIAGDLQLAIDEYFDRMQVVYDLNSGLFYDSISQNRQHLQSHYAAIDNTALDIAINGGSNYQEALKNLPNTFGDDQNPGFIFTRELTGEELESINTVLGFEPIPLRGLETRPELTTTMEELRQTIVDTVKEFAGSELYYELYPNCDAPSVSAAIEFAEDLRLQTHCLIIKLNGVDSSAHGERANKLVVDMETGIVYDNDVFVEYDETFETPLKVASLLAEASSLVFDGQEEFLWSNISESNRLLDETEIKKINRELEKHFKKNPIVQPTEPETEPPVEVQVEEIINAEDGDRTKNNHHESSDNSMEELSVSTQFIAAAARNFQNSKHYQTYAEDPSVIQLQAVYEYRMEDFEGFDVHLLMMVAGGINTDIHGIMANIFLVNPETGEIYSEFNVDVYGEWNFEKIEGTYVPILSSSFWVDHESNIWSENEKLTLIPQSDLDAVNQMLK